MSPAKPERQHQPETTFTLRNPPYTYMRLSLRIIPVQRQSHSQLPSQAILDEITIHQYITAALRSFLGLHGTAIYFDILKVDGNEAWVRVPRQDGEKVAAAVSSWSGRDGERLGVDGWGSWLGGVCGVSPESKQKLWSLQA